MQFFREHLDLPVEPPKNVQIEVRDPRIVFNAFLHRKLDHIYKAIPFFLLIIVRFFPPHHLKVYQIARPEIRDRDFMPIHHPSLIVRIFQNELIVGFSVIDHRLPLLQERIALFRRNCHFLLCHHSHQRMQVQDGFLCTILLFLLDISQLDEVVESLYILCIFALRLVGAAIEEQLFIHTAGLADELGIAQDFLFPFVEPGQPEQPHQMPLDFTRFPVIFLFASDLHKGIRVIVSPAQLLVDLWHGQAASLHGACDDVHRHGMAFHQLDERVQFVIAAFFSVIAVLAQNRAQGFLFQLRHLKRNDAFGVLQIHPRDKDDPALQLIEPLEQVRSSRCIFIMDQLFPAHGIAVHVVDDKQVLLVHVGVQFPEHIPDDGIGGARNVLAVSCFLQLHRRDVLCQRIHHKAGHTARKKGIVRP